jgi:hypothetical protein
VIEREVTHCWGCPFVEKEEWTNDEDGDSGTDYTGCALGMPAGLTYLDARKQIGCFGGPPPWCKLREGPVLVKLTIKPAEPEEPE